MLIFLKTVEFLLDVLLLRFVGCNNRHIAGFAGPFSQQALVYLSSRLTVPPIIMVSLDNENVRKKPNENYNNSSKGTKNSLAHGSWDQTQGLHRKSGGKTWRTAGWNPKHPGVFKRLVASGGDENPELYKPNENCYACIKHQTSMEKTMVPDASCQGASTMISASPGFSRDVLFSNTVVSKLPCRLTPFLLMPW